MSTSISIDELINLIGESGDAVDAVAAIITAITGIASVGIVGIMAVFAVIAAVVSFIVGVVIWILEAIPVYTLSKKMGRKNAWLAWIPFFGDEFRLWVLSDMAGDKPFTIYKEKYTIKNRNTSFWIYIAIKFLGGAVISAVVTAVSAIIPVIGTFSFVLMLVPKFACGVMEYVYLRDVLNIFKENKKSNQTASFVVTLLDNIATLGFARIVYLYTLLKREPLPIKEIVIEENAEA